MSACRRRARSFLLVVLCGAAVSGLAACGSSNESGLLSTTSASELRSTLARVEQTVENGDCSTAAEQVSSFQQQVTSLDSVEPNLREALAAGARRLGTLVADRCQAPVPETGPTGTTGTTTPDQAPQDEQQQSEEETGKGKEKKNKNKDKGNKKGQDGGQPGGGQDDQSGGSGGFVPGGVEE